MLIITLEFLLLVACVQESLACNGYTLKLNNIKNCGNDNVIKLENFDVDLDKECNVVPKGCARITKPFKTFNVHYEIIKPPMPALIGDADVCKLIEGSKSATAILTTFALPSKCPMAAQRICANGDKKINIAKYKNQLGFFSGNIKVKADGKHDSGSTCMEIDITIAKKRRG